MYKEVLISIRVPVGLYCFNSNEPNPVTCGNLDLENFGDGGCYLRCTKSLGNLEYDKNGKIPKPDKCLKLRSAD